MHFLLIVLFVYVLNAAVKFHQASLDQDTTSTYGRNTWISKVDITKAISPDFICEDIEFQLTQPPVKETISVSLEPTAISVATPRKLHVVKVPKPLHLVAATIPTPIAPVFIAPTAPRPLPRLEPFSLLAGLPVIKRVSIPGGSSMPQRKGSL